VSQALGIDLMMTDADWPLRRFALMRTCARHPVALHGLLARERRSAGKVA